jgi:FKBP-type peptidyl-prolyl cis-trans isomerase (trigger factor)
VCTYSTKPPYLIYGATVPPSIIKTMSGKAKATATSIFDLLKSTANSSNEELVVLNADNAKSVAKKDRIIALLCEDYEVVPTFTAKEYNGTKYITVSQETVTSLMNAILA